MPDWLEGLLIIYCTFSSIITLFGTVTVLSDSVDDDKFSCKDCLSSILFLGEVHKANHKKYNAVGGVVLDVITTLLLLAGVICMFITFSVVILIIIAFNKLFKKKGEN